MADTPNLKSFNAYVDENGQAMGQDSPSDLARPAHLNALMDGDPSGEAEAARLAAGRASEDAVAATEAETPPETLRQISDATLDLSAKDAADRGMAPVAKPS